MTTLVMDPNHPGLGLIVTAAAFLVKEVIGAISLYVGSREAPKPGEKYYWPLMLLGTISTRTWKDAPNSNKWPGVAMPPGKPLVFQGSGEGPPQSSADTLKTPPPIPGALKILILAGLCSLAMACAGKLSAAQQASIAGMGSSDAAVLAFEQWDSKHQFEIVKKSKTRQQAHARLSAYRTTRSALLDLCKTLSDSLDKVADALGTQPPVPMPAPSAAGPSQPVTRNLMTPPNNVMAAGGTP